MAWRASTPPSGGHAKRLKTRESVEEWAAKGVLGSVMLAKPFAPAQLVTAISNAINEADMNLPRSGGPN